MKLSSAVLADKIRFDILERVYSIKDGAHIASAFSLAEILAVLFNDILNFKRTDLTSLNRDKFILSKGHGALAYYCALYEMNIITEEEYKSFDTNGGYFPAQPSKSRELGIDFSSGTLGLGLSYAAGLAISKLNKNNRIYVILGDGEHNEGSIWESAMFIGHHKISNITAVVDYNSMQSDGFSKDILQFDLPKMYSACSWEVNVEELKNAFNRPTLKPKVIIAKTIKGKGISFMENKKEWHHNRISEEQYKMALKELQEREVKIGN